MKATTPIKSIMTTDLVTAGPNDTLENVRQSMTDNLIHHIPVVENEMVLGIVSLHDIHKLVHPFTQFNNPEAVASNQQIFSTMLAKEIMTNPVVKVKENESVKAAIEIFLQNMFHALPVVNDQDKLVGMLTTFDLIRHSLDKS